MFPVGVATLPIAAAIADKGAKLSTKEPTLLDPLEPGAKEKAKEQFDRITKNLDIKHYFSFDEAWDYMMEKRLAKQKLEKFRDGIVAFEEHLKSVPGALGEDPFPLVHTFADDMYIRQLTVPPQTLTVTKIHKQNHPFFLLKGTISILTEEGVKKITAPYSGITKAGTKRIIWHHDEVIFTTVHSTKETDLEKIEDEIIAKDFNEIDEIENDKIKTFIDVIAKTEA